MIAYLNGNRVNDVHFHQGGGSGDGGNIFAEIGYSETPKIVQDGIDYAKEIKDNWDASVTVRYGGFKDDKNLIFFPVVDFSKINNASELFADCARLMYIPTNLDMQNLTHASSMFSGCTSLNNIDCSHWNISKNIVYIAGIFKGCTSLKSVNLSNLDTSNISSLADIFHGCSSLTSLDVSHFDTTKVTDIARSFSGCSNLEILDMGNCNLSNVKTINSMFESCGKLKTLNIQNFNLSAVTNISRMFRLCSGLTSLDLSSWNTSNVTNMERVFDRCSSLTSLDLGSFDTSNVTNMGYMFDYCSELRQLKWNNLGNGSRYTSISFSNSSKLGDGYIDDLKNTFVVNSYNRASAGMSTCTITLHANTKARLTEDEIAQITSKGYTIA